MTAARGAALGRSSWPSRWWRSCCCAAAASTSTSSCSRTPASSSRATTCRSAAGAIGSVDGHRADRQQPGRGQDHGRRRLRAAARGDDRDRSAQTLAVGRRQPLHRADAGPEQRPKLDDGAQLGTDKTTTPVDLDQLFNTLDPRTRKGAAAGHPGLGDAVRRPGREGQRGRASTSTRRCRRPSRWSTSSTATSRRSATSSSTRRRSSRALAARRDDLDRPGLQHEHRRSAAIARENAALERALGLLPRHAAQGQHDVREPALDARRPRHAGQRLQAGDASSSRRSSRSCARCVRDARPTIADLRTLISSPGPGNDLIDLLRKHAARSQQAAKPAFAQLDRRRCSKASRCSTFIRPYTPDLDRLAPRLRPGRGELRRQRPLRARPAAVQHLQLTDNADGRPARRRATRRSALDRPDDRPVPPLPGRRDPAAARRLAPRGATRRPARLRPDARCPPGHEARCSPSLVARRRRRARSSCWLRAGRRRSDSGDYKVRAIFDNAVLGDPGRGREDRRRQGRQDRVARRDQRQEGRGRPATSTRAGFQDFRSDAECTIRPQSLIGEKFVECKPTQPRAAGRQPAAGAEEDPDGRRARASTCCRSTNTAHAGRHRPASTTSCACPTASASRSSSTSSAPALAGRGEDLRQVIRTRQPGAAGDRQRAGDPGRAEPGAREARQGLRQGARAARAREREQVADFIARPNTTAQATAERRAALEAGFELLPGVPARARADAAAARRASPTQFTPVLERPRAARPRRQPLHHSSSGRSPTAGTPALTSARRRGRRRPAGAAQEPRRSSRSSASSPSQAKPLAREPRRSC